jgi:hypothetical protein
VAAGALVSGTFPGSCALNVAGTRRAASTAVATKAEDSGIRFKGASPFFEQAMIFIGQ